MQFAYVFQIFLIYFFLLQLSPQYNNVSKRLCSLDNSRLVRRLVNAKWMPILDKYKVKLPLQCPLHPFRDIFANQQDAKIRDRPMQWTCRLCGKSFFKETFLDFHFEMRHKTLINEAEDAVCLADYCDIMRCEVFQTEESSSLKLGDEMIRTDIEVSGNFFSQNSTLAKANVINNISLLPNRTSAYDASHSAEEQNRQFRKDKNGQTKCQQTETSNQNSFNNNKNNNNCASRTKSQVKSHTFAESLASLAAAAANIVYCSSCSSSSSVRVNKPKSIESSVAIIPVNLSSDSSGSGSSNSSSSTNTTTFTSTPNETKGHADCKTDNSGLGDAHESNDCVKTQGNTFDNESNNTSATNEQLTNMQNIRPKCAAEELSKLKERCEYLVGTCIQGLITSMTDQQFKHMEEEMNRAVCWYLTCDLYWEDGPLEPPGLPSGLIITLIFILSSGLWFSYYIIWILFNSEETIINRTTVKYQYLQVIGDFAKPPPTSAMPYTTHKPTTIALLTAAASPPPTYAAPTVQGRSLSFLRVPYYRDTPTSAAWYEQLRSDDSQQSMLLPALTAGCRILTARCIPQISEKRLAAQKSQALQRKSAASSGYKIVSFGHIVFKFCTDRTINKIKKF